MKINEVVAIAGYLANPIRLTTLEIEIKEESIDNYIVAYERLTGSIPFPSSRTGYPVQMIPKGGDKWGREMRIYFHSSDAAAMPPELADITTISNRHGYEDYNQRVNNNALIDQLIEYGFVLGDTQDAARIRSRIPLVLLSEFDDGFAL